MAQKCADTVTNFKKMESHKNLDTIEEALREIEKPGETLDDLIDM